jgi:cytochrome c oxidase subunit II
VPVNRPVMIIVTSKDVIHCFKVIAMRVAQDAIPGVPIPIHFIPTKVGVYQVNCAQLCGTGHSNMSRGRIYVDTQEDYEKWFAAKVKASATTAKSFD